MPRQPRFAIEPIDDLYQQLRYAPVETRLRQMDATETLVGEIDPGQVYPQAFIEYRVTGYRSDTADESVMLVGEAVVADLVTLVLRLSTDAALAPDHGGRTPLDLEQVGQKLGVSARTIHRYRRRGLVFHMIREDDGGRRLVCFEDSLQRFQDHRRHGSSAGQPATRITPSQRERIVEAARALQRDGVMTPHAAARQLAARFGRSAEALRKLILAHDERSRTPVFPGTGPLHDRERALAWRAWRSSIAVQDVARRIGRSVPATHRVIAGERQRRLAALRLRWVDLPTFGLEGAGDVILQSPHLVTDIDVWPGDERVRAILKHECATGSLAENAEDALAAGLNWLKRRAALGIDALAAQPTARELDRIETDLRWAAMVRARLALEALPEALRTCELNLGRKLSTQPARTILPIVVRALELTCGVVDALDPSRGQHLLRVAAQAMDRSLGRKPLDPLDQAASRAAARTDVDALDLSAVERPLQPWRLAVAGREHLRSRLANLEQEQRRLIEDRYGWDGGHPMTIDELAAHLSRPRQSVVTSLFAVERALAAK